MKVQTDDSPETLLKLLDETRLEADTLRRRLERDERVLLSTRLIMGHELKRPTTAIRGYLDLALERFDRNADPEAVDAVRKAQRECGLIDELNSFFLRLLKADEKRITGRREVTDVESCVSEVLGHFPDDLGARDRVAVRISPDAVRFRTSHDAVRVILANVLENALLYSGAGKPVDLRIERTRDETGAASSGMLKIRVTDRGNGIPEASVRRVFEPFVRLHEQAARGAGLGLTLVRSLVELHGGSVHITSGEGQGTTVYVTLPETPEGDGGLILA
jgi:signal transduction histidine kinase